MQKFQTKIHVSSAADNNTATKTHHIILIQPAEKEPFLGRTICIDLTPDAHAGERSVRRRELGFAVAWAQGRGVGVGPTSSALASRWASQRTSSSRPAPSARGFRSPGGFGCISASASAKRWRASGVRPWR